MKTTWFERAIFLSWYCATPDCTFCYMSTFKGKIKNPAMAKRSLASVCAEAFLAKKVGWKIEFITAGTKALSNAEMEKTLKCIYEITGEKHLLNFGALTDQQIQQFLPYIKGYCGTVECINVEKRKEICPTKPIEPILETLKKSEHYDLKKAITIIIGIGETEDDIPTLIEFIEEHKIDKLILYALNPVHGTAFSQGPSKEYYLKWLTEIRKSFPHLYIVAGPWISRVDIIHDLLEAGATSITKFPAIKYFNSDAAKKIEEECKIIGYKLQGSMTSIPDFSLDEIDEFSFSEELKAQIKKKIQSYLLRMQAPSGKIWKEATIPLQELQKEH